MTTDPKPLNQVENWIAEHAVPVFAVLSVAVVFGASGVFLTFQRSGEAQRQVRVLEPRVTRINRAICDRSSLKNERKARRCAERIRVGLINCKRVDRCRAAFLAVLTYPPPARGTTSPPEVSSGSAGATGGGDAFQPPSHHGHQYQSPGSHPGPSTPVAPPPPAPEAPGASGEAPGHSGENPGQSGAEPPGQSGANHGQSSGVGVEACVLEKTCIGIEAALP